MIGRPNPCPLHTLIGPGGLSTKIPLTSWVSRTHGTDSFCTWSSHGLKSTVAVLPSTTSSDRLDLSGGHFRLFLPRPFPFLLSYLVDFCSASLSAFISSLLVSSTYLSPPQTFIISVKSSHLSSRLVSSSCHYCSLSLDRHQYHPNPLRASGFLLYHSRISYQLISHQSRVRKLSSRRLNAFPLLSWRLNSSACEILFGFNRTRHLVRPLPGFIVKVKSLQDD